MDEHIEELFPLYALDALTDEERAQVEAYVQAHPEAQARLHEEQHTAENLAYYAVPTAPSPQVKTAVINYARNNPLNPAAAPLPPVRLSWWQRFRQSMAMPALTGLAVVTAVFLFIWTLSLQRTVSDLEGQVTALEQALHDQDTILALLPEGMSLPIVGTEHQPDAFGQLIVAHDGTTAVLAVTNLPPLPTDQVYQFWLIGQDGPVGQGTFTVDAAGTGLLEVHSNTVVFAFDALGISIEPQGGSLEPTGDIVMLHTIEPIANET